MKISYDKEVDAAYIKLSDIKPSGVIEMAEGVNFDVTKGGKSGNRDTGCLQEIPVEIVVRM